MATSIIKADGTGDFTSLSAWYASLPSVLIEEEVAQISGDLGAQSRLTNMTKTTAADKGLVIEAAPGDEWFVGGEAAASFSLVDSDGIFILGGSTSSHHITIRNLRFSAAGGNTTSSLLRQSSGGLPADSNILIENCRISLPPPSAIVDNDGSEDLRITVQNCILTGVASQSSGRVKYFNNTVLYSLATNWGDNGTTGFRYGLAQRNAIFGFGPTSSNKNYLNLASGSADNVADDTSGNINNVVLVDQYTDPLNEDWSLKAGNVLQGAAAGGLNIGFVAPGSAGAAPVLAKPTIIVTTPARPRGWTGLDVLVSSASTNFAGHKIYLNGELYATLTSDQGAARITGLASNTTDYEVTARAFYVDEETEQDVLGEVSDTATGDTLSYVADFSFTTAGLPAAFETVTTPAGDFPVQLAFDDGEYFGWYWTRTGHPGRTLTIFRRPNAGGVGNVNCPFKIVEWDGQPCGFRCFQGGGVVFGDDLVQPEYARVQAALARYDLPPYDEDEFARIKTSQSYDGISSPPSIVYQPHVPFGSGTQNGTQDPVFGGHDGGTGERGSSRGFFSSNDALAARHAYKGTQTQFDAYAPTLRLQALYAMSLPKMFIWSHNHDQLRDPMKPFPGDDIYVTSGTQPIAKFATEPMTWIVDQDFTDEELENLGGISRGESRPVSRDLEHTFNHGYVYWLATDNPIHALMHEAMFAFALAYPYEGGPDGLGRYRIRQSNNITDRATCNQFSTLFRARRTLERISAENGKIFWEPSRIETMEEECFANHADWVADQQAALADPNGPASKAYIALAHAIDGGGLSPFMYTTYGQEMAYLWAIHGRPILSERLASHVIIRAHYGGGDAAFSPQGGTSEGWGIPAMNGSAYATGLTADMPYQTAVELGEYWRDLGISSGQPADQYVSGPAYILQMYSVLASAKQLRDLGLIDSTNYLLADLDAAEQSMATAMAASTYAAGYTTLNIKHAATQFPSITVGLGTKVVTFNCTASTGVALADATGVDWWFHPGIYNQDNLPTESDRGTVDTDASGMATVTLENTTMDVGQEGTMRAFYDDGEGGLPVQVFFGEAVISSGE
ncbi:hypothetical protein ACSMXM_01325 [Pacificimonas sp. ICDLI1SI03]